MEDPVFCKTPLFIALPIHMSIDKKEPIAATQKVNKHGSKRYGACSAYNYFASYRLALRKKQVLISCNYIVWPLFVLVLTVTWAGLKLLVKISNVYSSFALLLQIIHWHC